MNEQENLCDCGDAEKQEPHGCPYKEEIHNNFEFKCTCCKECQHQCAMDI